MLILSRKQNESIEIQLPNGDTIMVTLTQLNSNQARIGIEAPDQVLILRSELIDA